MANAILTGTYTGNTYKEYRRKCVEHFQYGKHIGKILDIKTSKNVTVPENTFYWVWNLKKSGNQIIILKIPENILNLLTEFLCRMDHTLFQTSS